MIIVDDVTKEYQLGKSIITALKGISLEIKGGEFVAIAGPSGSGKSTLLHLIGCVDLPTTGNIIIEGQNITKYNDSALSKIRNKNFGFIFQSFNLIAVLTAYENVEYPLIILGVTRKERKERVRKILDEVGLHKFIKHKPDELSGGQRQRVAIARALVTEPKLVLADEPTANLDSKTGMEILSLMNEMNERHKTTFLFSTHDQKIITYAKKVYKLADGKIVK